MESARPRVAISATNPCHLYDLAVALHARGTLGAFHSGYPGWRLRPPADFPLVPHSFRTLVTYGLLRLPAATRPASHRLFRWQDSAFDAAVARTLRREEGDSVHAMPGQALATFRRARAAGMKTILNHASGPVRQQLASIEGEYRRAGLDPAAHHGFDAAYFAREEEEYALADRHCVASSVVRGQLRQAGVPEEKIWVVPYGANTARFHPPPAAAARAPLRVLYAGQLTQRKGLRVLFAAMQEVRKSLAAELHLFGPIQPDIAPDLAGVRGESWITVHGAVSQDRLAGEFRRAAVLVLPSWEEAFGLVVVQALSCGLPCIVSDRVGASDLIREGENGGIFPVGDSDALAARIAWWLAHPGRFSGAPLGWDRPAAQLLALSSALSP